MGNDTTHNVAAMVGHGWVLGLDVGWVDLRLVDPDIANLIGLDFDSQIVVGFVAACVEGFLDHVGERSDKSKFGLLGRDLIGVGETSSAWERGGNSSS